MGPNLDRLVHGAIAYFDVDRALATGMMEPRSCFPSDDGGWIESDEQITRGCCPDPCGSGAWDRVGWLALSFRAPGPRLHKYRFRGTCCRTDRELRPIPATGWVPPNYDCSTAVFSAQAVGDLECNGTVTVFERTGKVGDGGVVEVSPLREMALTSSHQR